MAMPSIVADASLDVFDKWLEQQQFSKDNFLEQIFNVLFASRTKNQHVLSVRAA